MVNLCRQCDPTFPLAFSTQGICFQMRLTRQLPLIPISASIGSVLPRLALMLAHYLMPLTLGLVWLMRTGLDRHYFGVPSRYVALGTSSPSNTISVSAIMSWALLSTSALIALVCSVSALINSSMVSPLVFVVEPFSYWFVAFVAFFALISLAVTSSGIGVAK